MLCRSNFSILDTKLALPSIISWCKAKQLEIVWNVFFAKYVSMHLNDTRKKLFSWPYFPDLTKNTIFLLFSDAQPIVRNTSVKTLCRLPNLFQRGCGRVLQRRFKCIKNVRFSLLCEIISVTKIDDRPYIKRVSSYFKAIIL